MDMKALKYLIIAIVIFLASPVWATDWYIDPSGADGDGSYATPWKYYSSIVGTVAGDDFYQKHGTVAREQFTIPHSGISLANPTKVRCYDGEGDFDCTGKTLPIISGSDEVSGWAAQGGNVYRITGVSDKVWQLFDNNGDWVQLAHEPEVGDVVGSGRENWKYYRADANTVNADEVIESDGGMPFSEAQIQGAGTS
jgi:hypothetical protein